MYHLPEYTMLQRSAQIMRSLSQKPQLGNHYSVLSSNWINDDLRLLEDVRSQDETVRLWKAMQDLVEYTIPGCTCRRFVSVMEQENTFQHGIPFLCCEIFEPSHALIPITITDTSVLVVSPFNNLEIEKMSQNQYVIELCPVTYLEEFSLLQTSEEIQTYLHETIVYRVQEEGESERTYSLGQIVYDVLHTYAQGIQKQDQLLQVNYGDVSAESLVLMTKENPWFQRANRKYSLESIETVLTEDPQEGIISKVDFMPLVVNLRKDPTEETGHQIQIEVYKKEDGSLVRRLRAKPLHDMSAQPGVDETIVLQKELGTYLLLEIDPAYFYQGNLIFLQEGLQVPLTSVIATSQEIQQEIPISPMVMESVSFDQMIAMEEDRKGLGKSLVKVAKKAGIHSQDALAKIFGILKLPFKAALDFTKATMRVFKKGVEWEKEETLEMREKLLNDELDLVSEKFLMAGQTFRLTSAFMFITGSWFFTMIGYLVSRSKVRKTRLKAIERLEFKLDHAIERLDVKIEHARSESDYRGVDSLMKEKEMYEFARFKLKDLKKDLVKKESIKYATYDSDLLLSPRERLDQSYQADRPVDLRHNYKY